MKELNLKFYSLLEIPYVPMTNTAFGLLEWQLMVMQKSDYEKQCSYNWNDSKLSKTED